MQKQVILSATDTEELDAYGLDWETIREGANQWLILHSFKLPSGFKQIEVDVAINIVPGYPITQLDMAYFSPEIVRIDGGSIPAISVEQFLGKTWQRWSRHRRPENPWRPDLDNIRSHISLVEDWVGREGAKNVVPA